MSGLAYHAILRRAGGWPPDGLAVTGRASAGDDPQGVLWDHTERRWRAGTALVAALLTDPRYAGRHVPVDRAAAERIAREHLGTGLPEEAELGRLLAGAGEAGREPPAVRERDEQAVRLANEDWLRGGD